ncbi:MAG: methyltransferase [Caulobacter sp.]|nr:methyltransferase [Caulobacter sp.]
MESTPPAAEPQAEAAAVGPAAPAPIAGRRFGLIRRALGPLLRPIADYARRYLQAPVTHRLDQVEQHLGGIESVEDLLTQRISQLQSALEAARVQADHRHDALIQQIQATQASAAGAHHAIGELGGALGPRLDELEIKLRPLVPYDDDSWAVRMGDGYVLVARAERLFTMMLVDATTGGLEPGTRQVLKRLVRPGMSVADVGANIGLLTLVMARGTGADGRVYSFEPEAGPRAQLSKMKALNGLAWVDIRPVAVGREAGRLTFHVSDVIGHSSLYALPEDEERRATLIEVEVVRLDDALGADARLDLVKIDVEGAELDVLAGMAGLLAANPDIAVIAEYGPSHLARVGLTPTDWFAAFAAHGLAPYAIAEPSGRCAPCDPDALAGIDSLNIAFVRPGGQAQRRLLGA